MRFSLAVLALVASVSAQAVTQLIVPSSTPPAGCENSRQGTFTITIVNATGAMPTRRSWDIIRGRSLGSLLRRQDLTLTLSGGLLMDQSNRTGYIASNYQFQFDNPVQAGAIYTGGFSMCANGSLALGGSAVWWQCLSGKFYNLYDRDWAEHCYPAYFEAIQGAGSVYSTSPPVPESTGADQNTIANGGGTQSDSVTSGQSGIGGGATSTKPGSASASTSGTGAAGSASSKVSSASASGSSAASSATESAGAAATSSSSALAAVVTGAPQAVLAWAAGIIGAVALA